MADFEIVEEDRTTSTNDTSSSSSNSNTYVVPTINSRFCLRQDSNSEWAKYADRNYFYGGEIIVAYDKIDNIYSNYQIKIAAEDNEKWEDLNLDNRTFYAGKGAGLPDASTTQRGAINTSSQIIAGVKTFEEGLIDKEFFSVYGDEENYLSFYKDHIYWKNFNIGYTLHFPKEGGTLVSTKGTLIEEKIDANYLTGISYDKQGLITGSTGKITCLDGGEADTTNCGTID